MTDIEILKMYGTVEFHSGDGVEYVGIKCVFSNGHWSREGFGITREKAAASVMRGLHYLTLHMVYALDARDVNED